MRADGALIQRPADAGVDKGKGTCSSVSLVSHRQLLFVRLNHSRLLSLTDMIAASHNARNLMKYRRNRRL